MLTENAEIERIQALEYAVLTMLQGGTSNVYDFIMLQFKMEKIATAQVEQFAAAGWISSEQATEIMGTGH